MEFAYFSLLSKTDGRRGVRRKEVMSSWFGELASMLSGQRDMSEQERDQKLKRRLDIIESNAQLQLEREESPRDNAFLKRAAFVQEAPVIIGSTEHVGTVRARLRNFEAYLDYCMEEEALKAAGAPIFPVFIR